VSACDGFGGIAVCALAAATQMETTPMHETVNPRMKFLFSEQKRAAAESPRRPPSLCK
jgi:hypothetical protein